MNGVDLSDCVHLVLDTVGCQKDFQQVRFSRALGANIQHVNTLCRLLRFSDVPKKASSTLDHCLDNKHQVHPSVHEVETRGYVPEAKPVRFTLHP